jgi:hypothetical protein
MLLCEPADNPMVQNFGSTLQFRTLSALSA